MMKRLFYLTLSLVMMTCGAVAYAKPAADCRLHLASAASSTQPDSTHEPAAHYGHTTLHTENQRLKSENETQRARIVLLIVTLCFILTGMLAHTLYRRHERLRRTKIKEKLRAIAAEKYRNSLAQVEENELQIKKLEKKLQQAEVKKNELLQQISTDEILLLELDNRRVQLSEQLQKLNERAFHASPLYFKLKQLARNGTSEEMMTEGDWRQLAGEVDAMYAGFAGYLYEVCPSLSAQDMQLCLLLKAGFGPKEIACITCRSKQAVTSARKKLAQRIHGNPASPDQWDKFIRDFPQPRQDG